jgi:hypothetical protein
MASVSHPKSGPLIAELDEMHQEYRRGSLEHRMAPRAVCADPTCPLAGCHQRLAAIDFKLEDQGKAVDDALLRAWWTDVGFAGRCRGCGGWVHFTVRGKRAIAEQEARQLPLLADDWADHALLL